MTASQNELSSAENRQLESARQSAKHRGRKFVFAAVVMVGLTSSYPPALAAAQAPTCSAAVTLQPNPYLKPWFRKAGIIVNARLDSGKFVISQYVTQKTLRYAVVGRKSRPVVISRTKFLSLIKDLDYYGEMVITENRCIEREEGGD
jgi:hypothetical protein